MGTEHTDRASASAPDELAAARAETRAAFENRALIYHYLFEELAEELGPERAAELMKRAIYRRGLDVGQAYRHAAEEGDLGAIAELFVGGSPCGGSLFEPDVGETGEDYVLLRMASCPLVEAWRALGLDDDRIDLLCEIAAAVDAGTFEGAGLDLEFRDRIGRPGAERCVLEIRLRD